MKWTLENIIKECERLSAIKEDTFSIPVLLNGRLSKTLGRVHFTQSNINGELSPLKMEFSKKFLEIGSNEEIKKVIAHEWAHYYLTKTTKENHGHDNAFNRLSAEMGGNTGTSLEIENFKETYKYIAYCEECGAMAGGYARAGKVVKTPYLYKSRCCGANLRVEQKY